ncbi:MAG: outer membrane beta-barrel protein [Crocinitomicaceae bacterium]|nr:outer membrane beta-barrel protein [Crocinitomicaceae bacterium]
MKEILTALLLITGLTASAQTQELGKWKVGMTGSYDTHFEGSQIINQPNFGIMAGGCIEPYYESQVNFTAGIIGSYFVLPRLEVGVGVAYSKQETSNPNLYYANFCGTEPYYLQCGVGLEMDQTRFIETPVFVRYNFLKSKLNFHVETGLTLGYGLNNYSFASSSRFNLRSQGGLGMSYTFGGLINVSATAFYKKKITDFRRITNLNNSNSMALELRTSFIF